MVAENEFSVYILAEILKSGDPLLITETIQKMKDKNVSLETLDKWNIPFLIDFHAEHIPSAQELVQRIRELKNEAYEKQKLSILEDFRIGTIEELDGNEAPQNVIILLLHLMDFDDLDFVKCAFRLLNDLEVSLDDYLDYNVHEQAAEFRNQLIEADVLIAKIDKLMMDEDDEIDEDFELFNEDVNDELQAEFDQNEQDEEDQEPNEFNDSFMSNDSGVEIETDEDVQEQEAEEQEAGERHQNYWDALNEILCKCLAETLKTGNHDLITAALEFFPNPSWTLSFYRKYEISSMIYNYATHNDLAMKLFDHIERLGLIELGDEKMDGFKKICEIAERFGQMDAVPEPLMTILMGFLKSKFTFYAHHTATTLLKLRIPLEQFQHHEVKQFLLDYQGKNEDMIHLILNIREMEQAAGLY